MMPAAGGTAAWMTEVPPIGQSIFGFPG